MKIKTCVLVNLCHIFRVVTVNPYSLLGKKRLRKNNKKSQICSLFFVVLSIHRYLEEEEEGLGGPQPLSHMCPLYPAPVRCAWDALHSCLRTVKAFFLQALAVLTPAELGVTKE